MINSREVVRLSTMALTGTPAKIAANTAAKMFSKLCSPGKTKSLTFMIRTPLNTINPSLIYIPLTSCCVEK